MERAAALRKVKKVLGPNAYWRIGDHITSPERRERARRTRLDLEFRRAMLKRDMFARSEALLRADAEYQAIKAEWQRAQAEKDRAEDDGYRLEVGTRSGIFIQPKAYGDTWEEIFAKLEHKPTE